MVSVREALLKVSKGRLAPMDPIEKPAWRLIAENLYVIANAVDGSKRQSMRQATQAQRMILDRVNGTRKPGTHPATQQNLTVHFRDLTEGIEAGETSE